MRLIMLAVMVMFSGVGPLVAADSGSPIPTPKECKCKDCVCYPHCGKNCGDKCDGACDCKKKKVDGWVCDENGCRKVNNSGVVVHEQLYHYWYRYPNGTMVYIGSGKSPVFPSTTQSQFSFPNVMPSCTQRK